jgi:Flp pilus assembly protein TadG
MPRRHRLGSRRARAQALVEFALVLPIFLLLVFGIIDAGRLVFTYNTVANAARNAARVAIVNQSTSGTNTCDTTSPTAWPVGCAVSSGVGATIVAVDVSVTYRDPTDTSPCASMLIGCVAVVTVEDEWQPLTPIISQILGPTTVSSTSKIPVERVCSNPPPAPIPNC